MAYILLDFVCLRSSSSKLKSPATAVADGEDTESPFGPEIAFATGFEEATPPMPAIAMPPGKKDRKIFFQLNLS